MHNFSNGEARGDGNSSLLLFPGGISQGFFFISGVFISDTRRHPLVRSYHVHVFLAIPCLFNVDSGSMCILVRSQNHSE